MLIDTHAHLFWESYKDDLEEVLERAKKAGVEKIICPGTNVESSQKAIQLAKKYPGIICPAVGIRPEDVATAQVDEIRRLIIEHRELVVAIGEIGIDLYTEEMRGKLSEQQELFRAQCEMAVELDLPVIIHTRQSLVETLEVLDKLLVMPRGQFHCFSHDEEGLKQVLVRGFYASFCANITWSKRVARMVPLVPQDRLLLETDSPFMQPGGRNESANVTITGQIIADLRGLSLKALSEQTTENAINLFKL